MVDKKKEPESKKTTEAAAKAIVTILKKSNQSVRIFLCDVTKYIFDEREGRVKDFVTTIDFVSKLKELNISFKNDQLYFFLNKIKSDSNLDQISLDKLVFQLMKFNLKEEFKSEEFYFLKKTIAFLEDRQTTVEEWREQMGLKQAEETSLAKMNDYLEIVGLLCAECHSVPLMECVRGRKVNVTKMLQTVSAFRDKMQALKMTSKFNVKNKIEVSSEKKSSLVVAKKEDKIKEKQNVKAEEKTIDGKNANESNKNNVMVTEMPDESEGNLEEFIKREDAISVNQADRQSNSSATFEVRRGGRANTEHVKKRLLMKSTINSKMEEPKKDIWNRNFTIINFKMPFEEEIDIGVEEEIEYSRERTLVMQNASVDRLEDEN